MQYFKAINYDVERRIAPGVWLTLRDTGHIHGLAIAELRIQERR